MMRSFIRYASLLLLLSKSAYGQPVPRILNDTMLHVVKDFQPTIIDANKLNDQPVVKDSVPPAPRMDYSINSKKMITPFTVDPLKAAKMVGEPLQHLYNTLVKLGGGNYSTPYAEVFFANGRSKDLAYGAHAKHFSSKATLDGYGFGGFSDNQLELTGKKFMHKHTLSGGLDYNRNAMHYYGYDTSANQLQTSENTLQRYSAGGGNVVLQSHYTDSVHLNYLTKLKYYNLTDLYHTSEHNLSASADLSGYYEKQVFHAPLYVDYYNNRSKTDTINSFQAGFSPYLIFAGIKWTASMGMGIGLEKIQDYSRFFFCPNIDFNYNVVGNIIIPYAGIRGNLKKNTLRTLTNENPFLVPNPYTVSTGTKEFYAGIRGSISKTVSYNTRASYGMLTDEHMFIRDNTLAYTKGFNVVYYNATQLNLHGELQYQHTEKIKLIAQGDYNSYTVGDLNYAWQKPLWQTTLTVNYNLKNKIVATADFFVFGKRFDKVSITDPLSGVSVVTAKELKPVFDANIGLEYRYSKKLSAFLNLNNLGFKRYYYWDNYPTYKFSFLAGVTMAF